MTGLPFVVGDIQGCCADLESLLFKLGVHEHQRPIWSVGDLVNRGPNSLATLRLLRNLGARFQCVLGNHDLHLLASVAGVRQPSARDTIQEVLEAPDRDELIDWLRFRPLALRERGFLLCHAGLYPGWSVDELLAYVREVEERLRSPDWASALRQMYGNHPTRWSDTLDPEERLRFIINACTRMRFVTPDYQLDLKTKEGMDQAPEGTRPWFEYLDGSVRETLVFGHWSTLGLFMRSNLIGIDTGCVWGGALTAVDLETRAVIQIKCDQHQHPAQA